MAKDKAPQAPEPGPPTHEPVETPDLTKLRAAANDLMVYLRSPDGNGQDQDNYERVVLEEAMKAIYGPTVWAEISDLSRKADERFHEGFKKK